MHIPDGFLSTPVWATMDAATIGLVAIAAAKARKEVGEEVIPLAGTMAAFVFAAQMLNFPVLAGTSGHLLGAFLIARLIGPWLGVLAMTAILFIQALIFQDGGLLALGANIFNMAIIGCLLGYMTFKGLTSILRFKGGDTIALFAAAWLSVFLGAIAAAFQLGISGTVPYRESLIAMGGVHTVTGIMEGFITVIVVRFVERLIPSVALKVKKNEK